MRTLLAGLSSGARLLPHLLWIAVTAASADEWCGVPRFPVRAAGRYWYYFMMQSLARGKDAGPGIEKASDGHVVFRSDVGGRAQVGFLSDNGGLYVHACVAERLGIVIIIGSGRVGRQRGPGENRAIHAASRGVPSSSGTGPFMESCQPRRTTHFLAGAPNRCALSGESYYVTGRCWLADPTRTHDSDIDEKALYYRGRIVATK